MICNDVFAWSCADAEDVSSTEDLKAYMIIVKNMERGKVQQSGYV